MRADEAAGRLVGTSRADRRANAAAAGRWSQYTQLSRQMRQAGLLEHRRGWYAARIGLNLALLAAGCAAFAVLGDSW